MCDTVNCTKCDGVGRIASPDIFGDYYGYDEIACDECGGTGKKVLS